MKNQIFKNAEFGQIRTCMVNGETYFVGKDVASALGYINPTKAVSVHVDEEDRSMSEMDTHQRGSQMTIIINESGLYALILSSKLDSATPIQDVHGAGQNRPPHCRHGLCRVQHTAGPGKHERSMTRLRLGLPELQTQASTPRGARSPQSPRRVLRLVSLPILAE